MAGLTDPTLNPLATTTQQTSTAAPDWYNTMLSSLSSGAQNAITAGGVAGPSALQTQAYTAAPTAITAGQPALSSATNIATGAAGPDISQFMNPYTAGVVGEIGRLGQRQFNELLAPAATAGAAGSGQFGSRRGMQVYGNVARDVASDILGRQTGALQAGYKDAVTAALQEQQAQNQAAQTLGLLSGQAYSQGIGGLDVLSKLGAQQQAVEQAKLNYPMTALQNAATVMRGFTIPTTVKQTTTQPAGVGQMGPSPLGQIANIVSGLGSIAGQKIAGVTGNQTLGDWLISKASSSLGSILGGTSGAGVSSTGSPIPVDVTGMNVGSPVAGTGENGGAGPGQILGTDGNIYNDPSYGTGGYSGTFDPNAIP